MANTMASLHVTMRRHLPLKLSAKNMFRPRPDPGRRHGWQIYAMYSNVGGGRRHSAGDDSVGVWFHEEVGSACWSTDALITTHAATILGGNYPGMLRTL